jgi:imidazolonepropionase-like amidohydrolase
MQLCLFAGGKFLDPRRGSSRDGVEVQIEDGLIKDVPDWPFRPQSATCMDLRGRTVMPGPIDAHIYLVPTEVNAHLFAETPLMRLPAKGFVAERAVMLRGRVVKHAC